MAEDGKVIIGTEIDESGINKGLSNIQKTATSGAEKTSKEIEKTVDSTAKQAAEKTEKTVEKSAQVTNAKLTKISGNLAKVGTTASIAVTAPLVAAGKGMVTAASDYEENINKVDVAFGKNAETVKKWSKTALEQFGLSKNEALEATSLFGDMGTSMGLSTKEAAEMSTSLAGLAGDLSSFKNIPIDQAMTALNGIFTGETESLKTLGVVMTQTNLEQYAMSKGINKSIDEMTEAEKVQLRYAYVLDKAKNAQGDYARTSDGTANSLRTFKGSINDLAIVLGQYLLPPITAVVQKLTSFVNSLANTNPAVQKMAVILMAAAASFGPLALGVSKAIALFVKLRTVVFPAIAGVKAFQVIATSGALKWIALAAGIAAVAIALYKLGTNTDAIKKKIADVSKNIEKFISNLAIRMPIIIKEISDALPNVFQSLSKILPTIINGIQTILPTLAQTGLSIVTTVYNAIVQNLPLISRVAMHMVLRLVNGIILNLPQVGDSAIKIVKAIVTGIVDNLSKILNGAVKIVAALTKGIANNLPKIVAVALKIIVTLAKAIIKNLPQITLAALKIVLILVKGILQAIAQLVVVGAKLVAALARGILSGLGSVLSAGKNLASNLVAGLKQGLSDLYSIGANLVVGLWNGIADKVGWIVGKIKGFGSSVLSALKKALFEHSPSRATREMGVYLDEGLILGIKDLSKKAIRTASSTAAKVVDAMNDEIQKESLADMSVKGYVNMRNASGIGAVAGSIAVNATNGIASQLDAFLTGGLIDYQKLASAVSELKIAIGSKEFARLVRSI